MPHIHLIRSRVVAQETLLTDSLTACAARGHWRSLSRELFFSMGSRMTLVMVPLLESWDYDSREFACADLGLNGARDHG